VQNADGRPPAVAGPAYRHAHDEVRIRRVSSRKQDVRGQVVQLRAAGVDEVRTEVGSGAGSRPVLDQLLDEFVAGDVLVGTALDRLGRVGRYLIALVDDLTSRPRDSNKKAGARPALDIT
jgi:hypothetical protein